MNKFDEFFVSFSFHTHFASSHSIFVGVDFNCYLISSGIHLVIGADTDKMKYSCISITRFSSSSSPLLAATLEYETNLNTRSKSIYWYFSHAAAANKLFQLEKNDDVIKWNSYVDLFWFKNFILLDNRFSVAQKKTRWKKRITKSRNRNLQLWAKRTWVHKKYFRSAIDHMPAKSAAQWSAHQWYSFKYLEIE